ncbi:DUF3280 domain-containing protein [Algicella marina]|uniref:DUF2380 domain-containing protein n=1 Tax=Algicella marina TaxID=2683284 RepID=A0A6P1T472_9RHOB|nr:DUF3280 domain-containing protein [Algicella marina]QHQ36493.1 DUF2380 domain-containing protein [Algicella marina]
MKRLLSAACLMLLASSLSAAAAEGTGKVAFLGLVFLDTSTEGDYNGIREDEAQRLELLEEEVRKRFLAEGYDLLDLGPIAEELENTVNPADCYGCDFRMAEKLGAEYVLVGVVQKVSNLILSMNLVMKDVETKDVTHARSVDIRSNTDDSWLRGMRYIMKTAFFKE